MREILTRSLKRNARYNRRFWLRYHALRWKGIRKTHPHGKALTNHLVAINLLESLRISFKYKSVAIHRTRRSEKIDWAGRESEPKTFNWNAHDSWLFQLCFRAARQNRWIMSFVQELPFGKIITQICCLRLGSNYTYRSMLLSSGRSRRQYSYRGG